MNQPQLPCVSCRGGLASRAAGVCQNSHGSAWSSRGTGGKFQVLEKRLFAPKNCHTNTRGARGIGVVAAVLTPPLSARFPALCFKIQLALKLCTQPDVLRQGTATVNPGLCCMGLACC